MSPLSHRHRDLLRFIIGYQQAHGYGPSLEEMAEAMSGDCCGSVRRLLKDLERGGHTARPVKLPRCVKVLNRLPIPRAPDGAPLHFIRIGEARP
jgi:SOS-response transcriptional repressor LexA